MTVQRHEPRTKPDNKVGRRARAHAYHRADALRDVCDFVRSMVDMPEREAIAERIERHFAPAQAPE